MECGTINAEAFFVAPGKNGDERVHTLSSNVAAIQLLPADSTGETRLGMITQLPRGAELYVYGDGFNERTVRVRWADGFYFVFRQDLENGQSQAASV